MATKHKHGQHAKPLAAPKPSPWKVTIWTPKPYRKVTGYIGGEVPTPSGGGGGWETVVLPGRPPVQVWREPAPLVQTVPIIFGRMSAHYDAAGKRIVDGFATGHLVEEQAATEVEQAIDTLVEHFYRGSRTSEPPTVRIACATNAIPYRGAIEWVISGLTWGEAKAGPGGRRLIQGFSVEFTEHLGDERIGTAKYGKVTPSKKRAGKHDKRNGTSSGQAGFYVVEAGQTLSSIAHDMGLDSWRVLGAAQKPPITDPRSVRRGQRLRLPRGVGQIVAA